MDREHQQCHAGLYRHRPCGPSADASFAVYSTAIASCQACDKWRKSDCRMLPFRIPKALAVLRGLKDILGVQNQRRLWNPQQGALYGQQ